MSKDLWVAEFDRLYDEALDAGKSNADAAQWAQDNAQDAVVDRIAATIDNARMGAKEHGRETGMGNGL